MLLAGIICIYLFWKLCKSYSGHSKSCRQEEDLHGHHEKSLSEGYSEDCEEHIQKDIFSRVRLLFKGTYRGSVCGDSKVNPNIEELQSLNENPYSASETSNI